MAIGDRWIPVRQAYGILQSQLGWATFEDFHEMDAAIDRGEIQARGGGDDRTVNRDSVLSWLARITGRRSEKVGRPTKWDWDGFWIEACRLANTPDGLPECRADFTRHMQSWFADNNGGDSPSDSEIKEKARRLYVTVMAGK